MFGFIRKLVGIGFFITGVVKIIYYKFPQLGEAINVVNQHYGKFATGLLSLFKLANPKLGKSIADIATFLSYVFSCNVQGNLLIWGVFLLFIGIVLYITGPGKISLIPDLFVTLWFGYWLLKGLEIYDSSLTLSLIIVYNLVFFIYFMKNTLNDISHMRYTL